MYVSRHTLLHDVCTGGPGGSPHAVHTPRRLPPRTVNPEGRGHGCTPCASDPEEREWFRAGQCTQFWWPLGDVLIRPDMPTVMFYKCACQALYASCLVAYCLVSCTHEARCAVCVLAQHIQRHQCTGCCLAVGQGAGGAADADDAQRLWQRPTCAHDDREADLGQVRFCIPPTSCMRVVTVAPGRSFHSIVGCFSTIDTLQRFLALFLSV